MGAKKSNSEWTLAWGIGEICSPLIVVSSISRPYFPFTSPELQEILKLLLSSEFPPEPMFEPAVASSGLGTVVGPSHRAKTTNGRIQWAKYGNFPLRKRCRFKAHDEVGDNGAWFVDGPR